MKKLSLAVAVAATLGAGVAAAYTTAIPADGFLVPNVIHNTVADTTAVGIINHSTYNVIVYWTFFDQDSAHITDGQFSMTGGDYVPFVWSEESGLGLEDRRGYLTFHVGNAAGQINDLNQDGNFNDQVISGAAFQLNAADGDAVFVPTFPIFDFDLAAGVTDLTTLDADSYETIFGAAQAFNGTVDMRYEINSDWTSMITLWATGGLNTSRTVNMWDDAQNRKSVNFVCTFDELCFIDPSTIVGRPADFTRGYLRLDTQYISDATDLVNANATPPLPGRPGFGSFVSYTTVQSTAFDATQTVLNSHWFNPLNP